AGSGGAKNAPVASVRGGLDAGLIAVNSMGNPDFFGAGNGDALVGDIPDLRVPAAVHFVHSFSAAFAADPNTVAGRWLAHGAFAYVGSVHEPFLNALVPTPIFSLRVFAPMHWGVAARLDNAPPWRVTVLGDPLYTPVGPHPAGVGQDAAKRRIPPGPGLPEALKAAPALDAQLREMLTAKQLEPALRTLVLLGRDRDALRLAMAAIQAARQPNSPAFTAPMAVTAAGAAYREGDWAAVLQFAEVLSEQDAVFAGKDGAPPSGRHVADLAWQAAWPNRTALNDRQINLMRTLVRTDAGLRQLTRDAEEVARMVAGKSGAGGAKRFLSDLRGRQSSTEARAAIDELLSKLD
ncbi:MAG: hypothetical protein ACK51N_03275, partial [bacterium]